MVEIRYTYIHGTLYSYQPVNINLELKKLFWNIGENSSFFFGDNIERSRTINFRFTRTRMHSNTLLRLVVIWFIFLGNPRVTAITNSPTPQIVGKLKFSMTFANIKEDKINILYDLLFRFIEHKIISLFTTNVHWLD